MKGWDLIAELRAAGLLRTAQPSLRPLLGGVSSEIILVEEGPVRFVVKRALPKLRVDEDWFADVGRNRTEQEFFAYAGRILPHETPRILHREEGKGWFAMEFLAPPFHPWKEDLMAGRGDAAVAKLAGATLGRLHAASWGDPVARGAFATLANFTALRIDPYLRSAAGRVPRLRDRLEAEARLLAGRAQALVHGDYSPKNLLVAETDDGKGRLVILDAEAAWFGDPAFDVAFLLTHLFLKALYFRMAPPSRPGAVPEELARALLTLALDAWDAYAAALDGRADAELEARVARLLLCLLLARVQGKSRVEYLSAPSAREFVTDFVCRHLPSSPPTLSAVREAWARGLTALPP